MSVSRFAKVGDADASGRGNYFPNKPNTYHVRLVAAKFIDVRNKAVGAVVFDLEVIEVKIGTSGETDERGLTVPQPGDVRNMYLAQDKDAAVADTQRHMCLFGEMLGEILDPGGKHQEGHADRDVKAEEFEEFCEMVVGEDSPVVGLELKLVTYNKPTREQKPFTIHELSAVPDSWKNTAAAE